MPGSSSYTPNVPPHDTTWGGQTPRLLPPRWDSLEAPNGYGGAARSRGSHEYLECIVLILSECYAFGGTDASFNKECQNTPLQELVCEPECWRTAVEYISQYSLQDSHMKIFF